MIRYYTQYHSKIIILWISHFVNSKDGIDFAILFTLRESRRTSDPVLFPPRRDSFTLDACCSEAEIPSPGALKPSSFCNVGVYVIDFD